MTQSIVIQVGQCGNQIGSRFWDLALKEHASLNKMEASEFALDTFFYADHHAKRNTSLPEFAEHLKARAVLIDMEEGVLSDVMRSNLSGLFTDHQLISDVSGSGNNWATGFYEYGEKYRDVISETIRRSAEKCDCLQCFFLLHSMGGGTGSGLGTMVGNLIRDEYPDVFRFVSAVFPSSDAEAPNGDDVVTAPYNTLLALRQLSETADCVLPMENGQLGKLAEKMSSQSRLLAGESFNRARSTNNGGVTTTPSAAPLSLSSARKSVSRPSQQERERQQKPEGPRGAKAFDAMNNIAANLMLNLTSSSRYHGTMNVDLNEISMNLVPFPRLHFLLSAQAPINSLQLQPNALSASKQLSCSNIDQMFAETFSSDLQLVHSAATQLRTSTFLAIALLTRGQIALSDIRRNIDKWRVKLRFPHWNEEGWKIGHCSVPPRGCRHALLNLSNNTAIRHSFQQILSSFHLLYRRKAHVHHYLAVDNFEATDFSESAESIQYLLDDYSRIERESLQPPIVYPRLSIADQ